MSLIKKLEAKALEAISKIEKAKDLRIAHVEEDTAESAGKKLFRFHARKEDDPNGPHFSVVLDESGAVADAEKLSKEEGRSLFIPPEATVDRAAIAGLAAALRPITINPTINELVLNQGDTFNETITVTVPPSAGVSKADIYFLADTTGSMTTLLSAVQTGASSILSTLIANPSIDFAFGVGNYKDFPHDPYAFQHQQNLTKTGADVQNAINAWAAGGGVDTPEGQLFALE